MSDRFQAAREQMVERQLVARGMDDARVLAAMRRVPRHLFVDALQVDQAYDDSALPIHCQQTISQPYIVALMTQALALQGGERVLEIGTGSGYQAAVLAELGAQVFTIERHPPLASLARERLNLCGYGSVQIQVGDGTLGWPEFATFDRILVTAATDHFPPVLWEQLVDEGIAVAPLGPLFSQQLMRLVKRAGQRVSTPLIRCRFVPLIASPPESITPKSD